MLSQSSRKKKQKKPELYRYIYIIIFGKPLSDLHRVLLLNWSTLLALASLYTSRAGKTVQELSQLSINTEAAV